MLTAVTDIKITKELQSQFKSLVNSSSKVTRRLKVGFKNGSTTVNITYLPTYDIWVSLNSYFNDNHFWNVFGVGEPLKNVSNDIVVEINYSNKKVPNFRTAAIWASDNEGNFYLMHSGEIGGGKNGINKETFLNNYTGPEAVEVDLLKRVKKYFPITSSKDKKFIDNVADFVKQVDSIKKNHDPISSEQSKENQKDYFDEFFGLKSYSINKTITYNSDHGKIVKSLKDCLQERNFGIRKFGLFDLAIYSKNRMTHLFEVKTSITSQNIYSAIGQLYLYSEYNNANPIKVFVGPKQAITSNLKGYLKKLQILVLTYEIRNEKITFQNIPNITNAR